MTFPRSGREREKTTDLWRFGREGEREGGNDMKQMAAGRSRTILYMFGEAVSSS